MSNISETLKKIATILCIALLVIGVILMFVGVGKFFSGYIRGHEYNYLSFSEAIFMTELNAERYDSYFTCFQGKTIIKTAASFLISIIPILALYGFAELIELCHQINSKLDKVVNKENS